MVLTGTEVKSIRKGRLNLKDSYAEIRNGEVFVSNLHISPYEQGNINNVDPTRTRKLLLHKKEISKLIGYTQQKGLTLIPLEVYLKGSHVKMQLAVARGKKLYDKRHDEADRDAKRNMERAMKTKY
jgi:SsrA-binding protein